MTYQLGQGMGIVDTLYFIIQYNTLYYPFPGYAGGKEHLQKGSGVNHLCLPEDPEWDHYTEGRQNTGGVVFGSEYQTSNTPVLGMFGKNLQNYEVQCAVCRTYGRTSSVMIPGKLNIFLD